MNVEVIELDKNICYFKFENYFSEDELSLVWQEIEFLSYHDKLNNDTESALYEDGTSKAKKFSVWLNRVYGDQKFSNYLKLYKKFLYFFRDNFSNWANQKNHLLWRTFFATRNDNTLLNYYSNSDYYDSHMDHCNFTQLFFVFKEPKEFQGGDLIFNDFNHRIKLQNNMMILFPSFLQHQAEQITSNIGEFEKNKLSMLGRYSFATFYT